MPAEGDKLPQGEVPKWRTRVQYTIDADGHAGLRKHRSHEVEVIDHCMIAAEGVSELGIEKRDWENMASVEAIAASGSHDRQVVLTPKPGGRLPLVELDKPVSVLRVDEKDGGVHRVHGRAFVRERADERTYRVGNGGFWQVHPKAAQTLMLAVMQGLTPARARRPSTSTAASVSSRAPWPTASATRARSSASSPASARWRTPATTSPTSRACASNRARSNRSSRARASRRSTSSSWTPAP